MSFFSGFYKYGTNTELFRLKTESHKYGWDTPLPASRPIIVFFCKYRNGRDKYKNTGGTGGDFSVHFYPYTQVRCFNQDGVHHMGALGWKPSIWALFGLLA